MLLMLAKSSQLKRFEIFLQLFSLVVLNAFDMDCIILKDVPVVLFNLVHPHS